MAVKGLDIKPFSKQGYKTYKFEEIAFSISERVEPKQTSLEIYVGLEHLDPDSIHIKRHGTPADVEGIKLKVYPGDLIFGKRRAYQRKAAVANFEGICSAHAMVLRANPKVIIPELFPFFIHSDQFMNRAIDISVGSLSPTINWGALKSQEFLLPPKEQQDKLAELLWAGDEVVENYQSLILKISKTKKQFLDIKFSPKNTISVTIEEIADCLDNKRMPVKSSNRVKGIIPYYGASGIVDYVEDFIYDEPILLISEDGENLNSRNLPIAYAVDGKSWVNNHAHVLRINKGSRYLVSEYFNSRDISDIVSGSTRPKLNKSSLMEMTLFLPDFKNHSQIQAEIERIDLNVNNLASICYESKQIQKQLINQIFSE